MSKIVVFTFAAALTVAGLTSCHHTTIEDQAAKMAEEYTERNCPTPEQEMSITDSVTFDRATKTFNYYYRLTSKADDPKIVAEAKPKLVKALKEALRENTSMKAYKDASFNFNYIYRSDKTGDILLQQKLTPKDYNK